jgi:hypothetical protein
MITEFNKQIRKRSIDNTRLGKVLTRNDTTYTIRVSNTVITCNYSGSIYVGQYVTLVCPDGDLNKAYILSSNPVGIGEGGNVAI